MENWATECMLPYHALKPFIPVKGSTGFMMNYKVGQIDEYDIISQPLREQDERDA
ncbi:hypothetical protein Gxy13693_017_003 [Komagataeibacter xylinus NBRC 13693]|uniref:Uncharacterized protein n=1 Tax=Komagataeibacter xylinus NBRC 13693 TaxID=1234668 RepID=A0A0D6Q818_KOMXY|nr:hypothetical protein Gxy13693_017_003 [Komagataeibacter xylinus NBRC 13693]